ncbi:RNA ligase 1 family protein [Nocardia otitidiscaviarum]|uniref:RNA ligase 1 family protein n=1 Tax=Nocardia otitidiscaviarum TaxID=1823 RepID=UPI0004A705C1|nr:DUF5565 family protein [Nocardia otitidiscaviarum]
MKKIPTLFVRDPNNMARVLPEVHPKCDWVTAGEGVATAKLDGVCTMLDGEGGWWARREIKPGKAEPANFIEVDHDPVTGKRTGWEPIGQSSFAKLHRQALEATPEVVYVSDSYELVGPKVNGNPHGYSEHTLVRHGSIVLPGIPTDFDGLRALFAGWRESLGRPYEGVVWHHPDGRRAKLKVRDFPKEAGA